MDIAGLSPAVVICLALVLGLLACVARIRIAEHRADKQAAALLQQVLTTDEQRQLLEHRYLDVTSRSTPGRVYRIPASPGLVTVLDEGKFVMRLCSQPRRRIPRPEHVLVHKLMLEGAE